MDSMIIINENLQQEIPVEGQQNQTIERFSRSFEDDLAQLLEKTNELRDFDLACEFYHIRGFNTGFKCDRTFSTIA